MSCTLCCVNSQVTNPDLTSAIIHWPQLIPECLGCLQRYGLGTEAELEGA